MEFLYRLGYWTLSSLYADEIASFARTIPDCLCELGFPCRPSQEVLSA
jgi:hypothetical protein